MPQCGIRSDLVLEIFSRFSFVSAFSTFSFQLSQTNYYWQFSFLFALTKIKDCTANWSCEKRQSSNCKYRSFTSCAMMLSCWSSEFGVFTRLRRLPAGGGDVIVYDTLHTDNTTDLWQHSRTEPINQLIRQTEQPNQSFTTSNKQHIKHMQVTTEIQDRQALLKAKYCPWAAAVSWTQENKKTCNLDLWPTTWNSTWF